MLAERAGLQAGDRFAAIDGRAVDHWMDVVIAIRGAAEREIEIEYLRAGQTYSTRLMPAEAVENGRRVGRIGIAPQDLPRLFTEFQQLDAGASKQHQGTGLGLALTRRLVEAQGGSVGVRSTPGVGSLFHLVLDRAPGTQAAPGRAPASPAPGRAGDGSAP